MSQFASTIVWIARSYIGSGNWKYSVEKDEFKANTNKCNKFVYDVMVDAKVKPPPTVSRWAVLKRPPTAGEWADPNVAIQGWQVVRTPEPGDVVAEAHQYADATGHVGIVVGTNKTVSASALVGGVIVENDWGFRPDNTPTFRRYMP